MDFFSLLCIASFVTTAATVRDGAAFRDNLQQLLGKIGDKAIEQDSRQLRSMFGDCGRKIMNDCGTQMKDLLSSVSLKDVCSKEVSQSDCLKSAMEANQCQATSLEELSNMANFFGGGGRRAFNGCNCGGKTPNPNANNGDIGEAGRGPSNFGRMTEMCDGNGGFKEDNVLGQMMKESNLGTCKPPQLKFESSDMRNMLDGALNAMNFDTATLTNLAQKSLARIKTALESGVKSGENVFKKGATKLGSDLAGKAGNLAGDVSGKLGEFLGGVKGALEAGVDGGNVGKIGSNLGGKLEEARNGLGGLGKNVLPELTNNLGKNADQIGANLASTANEIGKKIGGFSVPEIKVPKIKFPSFGWLKEKKDDTETPLLPYTRGSDTEEKVKVTFCKQFRSAIANARRVFRGLSATGGSDVCNVGAGVDFICGKIKALPDTTSLQCAQRVPGFPTSCEDGGIKRTKKAKTSKKRGCFSITGNGHITTPDIAGGEGSDETDPRSQIPITCSKLSRDDLNPEIILANEDIEITGVFENVPTEKSVKVGGKNVEIQKQKSVKFQPKSEGSNGESANRGNGVEFTSDGVTKSEVEKCNEAGGNIQCTYKGKKTGNAAETETVELKDKSTNMVCNIRKTGSLNQNANTNGQRQTQLDTSCRGEIESMANAEGIGAAGCLPSQEVDADKVLAALNSRKKRSADSNDCSANAVPGKVASCQMDCGLNPSTCDLYISVYEADRSGLDSLITMDLLMTQTGSESAVFRHHVAVALLLLCYF